MSFFTDPLGDKKSELWYMNHMGDDFTPCDAARVSFAKRASQYTEAQNIKLLKYLARSGHESPFFHVILQVRWKMPLFVARQWFKHTVGIARNEVSRRYVDSDPEFYEPVEWRARHPSKKQGSADEIVTQLKHEAGKEDLWGDLDNNWYPTTHVAMNNHHALEMYRWLLDSGVAPEQARMVLPQSMYTSFVETMSIAAAARICRLRLAQEAQWETRKFAQALSNLCGQKWPILWPIISGEATTE